MENHTPTTPNENESAMLMRYVLGKLDPAEALEFRKKLDADQDLLIEAESLRHTLNRLSDLPVINAPKSLLDKVIAQHTEVKKAPLFNFRRYMAVAAVALFTVSAGSYFMMNNVSSNDSSKGVATSASEKVSVPKNTVNAGQGGWKDNKQVVTIDQIAAQNADSIKVNPKLKPVTNPVVSGAPSTNLTLTRSKN